MHGIKERGKINQAQTLNSVLLYLGSQMGPDNFNIFEMKSIPSA